MRQFIAQISSALGKPFFEKERSGVVEQVSKQSNAQLTFSDSRVLAHACATPLTVLQCCIEKSLESTNESNQRKLLHTSLLAIDRMRLLLENALQLDERANEYIDLQLILAEAIQSVQLPNQNRITCIISKRKNLCVIGNALSISEMLVCMLKNAVEASSAEKIIVYVSALEREARVDITDFGQGMSDTHLKLVTTTPFTTKNAGNGLGLPFVRNTLKKCGGSLSILSKQGVGTWISIRLPLATG